MKRDLRLRIEGNFPERLLNRALQAGARIAQIKRSGKRVIVVSTDERSADILSSLCEKYFLDFRILHRGGLSALRDVLRARWTLLPGLLLCAVICMLVLSRIWLVDICFTGSRPELGSKAVIRASLTEAGIHPGMPAGQIDTGRLQKQLLSDAEGYSFIGVRRQGIRLLVEAAPEVPSPQTYQISHARDLVASRDGVVESITVLAGSPCVKPGDTVRAGQALILGEEAMATDAETREEITAPVSALGEVVARCWYEGGAEGYLNTSSLARTGKKSTDIRLKLMDFSLPLLEGEVYPLQEVETQSLPIVGLFLPLRLERSTHYETRELVHSVDPEILKGQLEALSRADVLNALSEDSIEYEIASQWTDASRTGNTLRLRTVYEIYTDIATKRDAFIEEVN